MRIKTGTFCAACGLSMVQASCVQSFPPKTFVFFARFAMEKSLFAGGTGMSNIRSQRHWIKGFLGAAAFLALAASGIALADPPARVARLAQISGTVSYSPAGEEDWALAQANRPLIAGDRVWADTGSRAE